MVVLVVGNVQPTCGVKRETIREVKLTVCPPQYAKCFGREIILLEEGAFSVTLTP